ncbi:hypothetical protein ACP70R_047262 [Stipagrostis hirtigluma subsp. patula]
MSPATAIASLLFFSLLLLPQFGTCHYTSYTSGSRKFFLRSSDDSRPSTSPAAASCSSISSGLSNGKLPLVHRLSACSPLNDDGGNSEPSPADVLRRDAHRIGSLVAARSGVADAASPAPGRAPGGLVTVPTNGTPVATAPGVQDYTVLVGYGTPAQQLPLALDTSLGISLLRCKPCASGASNCDPAFDHTRSSTFAQVPCGSPDCRTNCSGSVCPLAPPFKRGTVVQDVLTLAPAAAVRDFAFGCVEVGSPGVKVAAGLLDLSRDSRSLASRLAASPAKAPSFSYCLPLSRRSHGFLSVGAGRPAHRGGDRVTAPLVRNPAFPNMYFVELTGISLGPDDLPIPPTAAMANTTAIDAVTSFTFLKPAVYAALRDAFRREMSRYPPAPAFQGLDTCYNFTGLEEVGMPLVGLKFGNGKTFAIEEGMMYYQDPSAAPFTVACLAFAPLPPDDQPIAVIGTMAQLSTEVVYDVSGGTIEFIPNSC